MPTAYDHPNRLPSTHPLDDGIWCGMGDETHTGTPATRVFEYDTPDPHSACGETERHYALICDHDSCLASAENEARFWHAVHQDFYPATPADLAAIAGGAR